MGDLGFIAVALLAFISVAGVGWALVGGGDAGARKRVKAVAAASAGARSGRRASTVDIAQARRKQLQETLKEIEDRQKQQRRKSLSLGAQLRQAGMSISPMTFWLISIGCGAAVLLLMMARGQPLWMSAGVAFAAGFGLPRWFVSFKRKRRMRKFIEEFVNAIDIIVRGVKSGLPLHECLKVIGREIEEPVSGEFRKLTEEQAAGLPLEESLGRIYQRMPLPEVNFFATVLTIQQKTGGNLAEALGNLSTVLRARKMMREKIQALSSEAKASAMIIGALPPAVLLIVYVTTPSYMSAMFTEPSGRVMLAGSAIWMGMGIYVMRSMINFKF